MWRHELDAYIFKRLNSLNPSQVFQRKFSETENVEFTGYDLIPENIENAKRRFSNTSWHFQTFDLVSQKISKHWAVNIFIFVMKWFLETSFDLVINRHTAIHLGLMDNIKVSSSFVIYIQAKLSDVSKYCWLKKSFSSNNYFSNLDQEHSALSSRR